MCKKANLKLHALARVFNFTNKDKLRLLMKEFIESQFSYWINKLHERALCLVYKGDKLPFQQLLNMDNSFTTHHRNLQKLVIGIFKVKNNLSHEYYVSTITDVVFLLSKQKTFEQSLMALRPSHTGVLKYGH